VAREAARPALNALTSTLVDAILDAVVFSFASAAHPDTRHQIVAAKPGTGVVARHADPSFRKISRQLIFN
jgi:hypothetical protein